MKKQKILFLTLHTFSLTGGIEKVCRSLGKALSDLAVDNPASSNKLLALHDNSVDLDLRYQNERTYKAFSGNVVAFAISSLLNGIRSNQVILSHINLLLFAKLIKFFSPKTKIIMLAHGIEVWRPIPSWKKKFLQQNVEVWAVSSYTASQLIDIHQLDIDKIKIVNNCLDPFFQLPTGYNKPNKLLKQHNLDPDQPILFTLTRLSSQESYKGYDRVLKAIPQLLKKFPTLQYILAGKADPIEKERVERLVQQLNIQNHVTLVGFIDESELTDYFCLGDIFIMPSTMEGFGIVFIEAAACGAQIIGGNKDGSVDALLNGRLGTLVDPENVDEITFNIENKLLNKSNPMQIQHACLANFGYAQYVEQIKRRIAC
jgi:phosphatidylinositol alpha-1,6-mannosyltransferase